MTIGQSASSRPRDIPDVGNGTSHVGHINKKPVGQNADMAVYVTYIKGKPTYVYMMERYNPATALKIVPTTLKKRDAVVFTDRDGPLDKTSSFLNDGDKIKANAAMIPSALEGAKRLNDANVGLAIVTNQGGFQTGKMTLDECIDVNVRIAQQVADAGGHVDAIFICPFVGADTAPTPGTFDARKPSPGMVLFAKSLARACNTPVLGMVGDQRTDGAAAQGADVKFYGVTDTVNGRWDAELAQANKKGEKLPKLDQRPSKLAMVFDFKAAVAEMLRQK